MNINMQYLETLVRLLEQLRQHAQRGPLGFYTVRFDGVAQRWSERQMLQLFDELGLRVKVIPTALPELGSDQDVIHLALKEDCAYLPLSAFRRIFKESQRMTDERLSKALSIVRELAKRYWLDIDLPLSGKPFQGLNCPEELLLV